ncbi:MAG TPA: ABC transporter ATP-binding protein/permease [Microvirga sp.]|jgi:putative ABC transport system ATP-binding protein|nr:ABC transporter ATP-binding protein/permease [Microvirga sp.]
MDKSLFRYIWRHSRRDQLIICSVVLASLPFYFASLDLPRRIVNEAIQGRAFEGGRMTAPFLNMSFTLPDWLGGGTYTLFEGFQLDRLSLLFGLSGVFLFFVLVNGAFKYWINVEKGALGERMLRRMRFELFALVLRFTPETLRTVKSTETATIIKDEVEPIGGFIGDAFITPAFLGTQALTALAFIMVQNIWLGLMAMGVIGIQFTIIPKLRRELLRLGKQRQLASRRLAGRVGEVLDGIEAVHVHNTRGWERAEIGHRLYELFDIRFRIYRRKFSVKFLNNLLAQVTPFLFYAVGGYFALRGQLDIGQLVAVIGAYRELPPPLKELIDWDQQRLDVQVKYDQVVQHFSPERLLPGEEEVDAPADVTLSGPLEAEGVTVADPHGGTVLDGATFALDLPARVAMVADGTASASVMARILARRSTQFSGRLSIGGADLTRLPAAAAGQRLAYAGVDPILFPGSIRDNLVYGLRFRPVGKADEGSREAARRLMEAKRTGNPVESIHDPWIDYSLAGAGDEAELDRILLDLLSQAGLQDDLYRFGLSGLIDPDRDPELASRIVEARALLRKTFSAAGMADLVEPFASDRYNDQATVAENLLFGVPTSRAFMGRSLAENPAFRDSLDETGLCDDLLVMGASIAETMTEIFRGLPPGHPLFEQFSFIGADELDEFEAILRRRQGRARALPKPDQTRLLALPLAYVEPRHRLGLLGDELKTKLVQTRAEVHRKLARLQDPGVDFYDEDQVCAAAPLKDNLLFGRVSYRVANAQGRVAEAMSAVVTELGLRPAVERIGLDHQVGPAGRLLTAQQRAVVNLVRCLVKRPDILVVDGALAPFDEARAQALLRLLLERSEGQSLFFVLPNDRQADLFEAQMRFARGQVTAKMTRPPAQTGSAQKRIAGGVS